MSDDLSQSVTGRVSSPPGKPREAEEAPLIGRVVLGRYRVLCLLARGGMGEVYLARSEGALGFHKPVVIKRVLAEHAENQAIIDLFRREARVMSNLRHPNIVSVLDFGEDGGDHLLVIEYVHGFHLGRWLRWTSKRGGFPVERAVQITLEVLAALDSAHGARSPDGASLGIVHRDVSPGNVLIDVEGMVKLADFGVARMQGEHTVVEDDQVSVRGKFPYLSAELFDGTAATPASDTYAAAVVLDEMLRGENAFRMKNVTETLTRVLKYTPPSLASVRSDVPPALAAVIQRALAKRQQDRFESAAAFAAALREVRTSTDDAARRELATAARADFLDATIANTVGAPALSALEALWHGPAPQLTPTPPRRVGDDLETKASVPLPRGPSRATLAAWGAVLVVAIGSASALAYYVTRSTPLEPSAPVVILVDRGAHAAVDASVTAPSTPDAAVLAPPTTAAPDTTHRGPRVAPIEAPFRARAGAISRCFADHVSSVEGSPEVVVHFEVAADGTVQRASLTPGAMEPTALGQCLLGIARSTHFVAQPSPFSFRVPLGARRVGG